MQVTPMLTHFTMSFRSSNLFCGAGVTSKIAAVSKICAHPEPLAAHDLGESCYLPMLEGPL
jgi:hypothetical protein